MSYGTKAANAANRDNDLRGVDTGTVERTRHGGGVHLAPRTQSEGGIETSVGAQALYECALDRLLGPEPGIGYLAGTQGSRADRAAVARSRFEAGMKMRRLFVDAGLVGMKAFDPDGARGGTGEMSDRQAMARRSYNDLMRRLGTQGAVASGPCCFDELPTNSVWLKRVTDALDKLCEVVL